MRLDQRALRFANGEGALPALMAAQRFLAASAIAFRPAALRVRFCLAGAAGGRAGTGCLGRTATAFHRAL